MSAARLALLLVGLVATGPASLEGQTGLRGGAAADTTARVHGTVTGRLGEDRFPLADAMVTFRSEGGRTLSAVTDRTGRYRLSSVPPRGGALAVHHIGFSSLSLEVSLSPGRTVQVDLEVEARPLVLARVAVSVPRAQEIRVGDSRVRAALAEARFRSLEGGVGLAESGLGGLARGLPGGDDADPSDFLMVRGGGRDLRLVLLDGAPIYAPFHLAGVVSSFQGELLEGADLHVGGAPSRYDGGLAYILDLRTRDPRRDRVRAAAQVDGLSARAMIEGALPGGGAGLIALRGIHGAQSRILELGRTPFGYQEGVARARLPVGGSGELHFTAFGNLESVALDLPDFHRDQADWGNRLGAFGYRDRIGETGLATTVSVSTYEAGLPVGRADDAFLRGTSRRIRLAADLDRPWRDGVLRYGISGESLELRYTGQPLTPTTNGGRALGLFAASGREVGAYLEADHPLGEEFRLRVGLRGDHFSLPSGQGNGDTPGGLRVSPRFALEWRLSPDASFTVAAGRYHQFTGDPGVPVGETLEAVRVLRSGSAEATRSPAAVTGSLSLGGGGAPPLPVASANHLVLSLDQTLARDLQLSVDGFVKRFADLPGAAGVVTEASGVDVRAVREGPGVAGWLGYSLTWFWSRDERAFTEEFAGRHVVSGGVAGPVGGWGTVGLELSYGSGLPYSAIPVTPDSDSPGSGIRTLSGMEVARSGDFPFPGGVERSFLRVDAEFSGLMLREWWGRPVELRPYVRILNALDRRDGLFQYFEPWRDGAARSVADQPFLPLVGVEWRF